jgi:RHS repeat-associated protein
VVPLGSGERGYGLDEAGRLTGIDYDEGHRLTYAYDPTGNMLSQAGSTPLRSDSADGAYTYDAACQLSNDGYAYDLRGREISAPGKTFAYDGAGRLTSVSAGGSTVTFTYNGLGDLRTRTANGATTHYYHNYALGLNPIVAEQEAGAYKRFYVYTPGGSLLYSIDPATGQVRFYHFDRVGSTLFLTDGAGAVSDAYAYDPYGNLLGHTGTSDQPFTYVGRYGVRWEPVGALYDMRARAYDPATARFLSRDPVWPDLTDPRSLNPYQYAYQNPLRYIDPRGRQLPRMGAVVPFGARRAVGKLFEETLGVHETQLFSATGLEEEMLGVHETQLFSATGLEEEMLGVHETQLFSVTGLEEETLGVHETQLFSATGLEEEMLGVHETQLFSVTGLEEETLGVHETQLFSATGWPLP